MSRSAPTRGEITCFLGSNGAGKTTTIRTILGLARTTAEVQGGAAR
ncbi:MAG TPA: ATP-binding cassette domain-containing protein [Firmicutes bacterium]|nr:ATP-binding cassette domain-containing protein [Bacillota bacterium]